MLLMRSQSAGYIVAAGGAGFLDGPFDRFAGFAGALLNPANPFFLLAFGELEIANGAIEPQRR